MRCVCFFFIRFENNLSLNCAGPHVLFAQHATRVNKKTKKLVLEGFVGFTSCQLGPIWNAAWVSILLPDSAYNFSREFEDFIQKVMPLYFFGHLNMMIRFLNLNVRYIPQGKVDTSM